MKKKVDIIITTGGTGGHIFPARALYFAIEEAGKYAPLVITDRQSYKSNMWHPCKVKGVRGGKIAGIYTEDKMTENQVVAKVRGYFAK